MKLAPFLLLLLLALSACERDVYTVRMQASDAGFERRVEVFRLDSNGNRKVPPTEVLDPIRAVYGSPGPLTDPGFAGTFEASTPTDIGGHGSFRRTTTSLGSTTVHMERFRGDDNLSARIERIERAAATGADLFLGWLDRALAEDPAWPAFRATLANGVLERDLRNLALMVWLERNSGRTAVPPTDSFDDEALLVRLASYLHEHGYITSDEILLGSMLDDGDPSRLLAAWLARGMGYADAHASPALTTLASDEATSQSWDAYLASPGGFRLLEDWAAEAGIEAAEEQPEAEALLDDLLTVATGTEPTDAGAEDEVHLALACPVEPLATNGKWSAEAGEITWWFNVEPSPDTRYLVPAVVFASWAEPDEAFQTEHLGGVVLTGEPLAAYCAWHALLPEAERARWDAMLAGVHRREEARAAIEAFEIEGMPGDTLAGRTILLAALGV